MAASTFATMPKTPTDILRDSMYVTVGMGLITVQKLQVRRRKVEKMVESHLGEPVGRMMRFFDSK